MLSTLNLISFAFATEEAMHEAPPEILPKTAVATTHVVAAWLMRAVTDVMRWLGLEHHTELITAVYALVVCALALILGQLLKHIVLAIVYAVAKKIDNGVFRNLRNLHFFSKVCRIIPPLFVLVCLEFSFVTKDGLALFMGKCCWIYIVVVMAMAVNTAIYVIWLHIDERENKRKLPLKGVIQLIKGVIWIIATIIIIAVIVNKSPAALFAGLGAFAAVLMLVFKDSILGVVAGVQLSENDMLRVGDWIAIDGTTANGNVEEVTLTTVKVRNWDKTTTTVAPYTLVSGSFKNYRSMQLSETRRIDRTYFIDQDSVDMCTDDFLEKIKTDIPLLADYITKKQAQAAAGKVSNVNNPDGLADGTIETNLGLFRAYLKMYLDAHPHISHNVTDETFICTLQQTANGIPLQIYCFTTTSKWVQYEAIQSEIFEHIAVMLPKFNLYAFENASGRDNLAEGYLESGGKPDTLFGMPKPFLLSEQ